MTLNRYKLGQLIEWSDERNENLKYGLENVKGISIKKEFIETKADMNGVSLKPYKIVKNDYFAYVPITSRNGEKITLAHNVTEETYIVSSSYIVFKVIKPEIIDSDYLFMYFNRYEFDRYSRFNSWGSAREAFSWQEMCDIELELPSIKIQKKYVAIYKSMLENQICYEKGVEDFKLICDSYIEQLRRNMTCEEIGKYLIETRIKNELEENLKNRAVSNTKKFVDAKDAVTNGVDTKNYLIVEKNDFAYNTVTTRNADKLSIAYNDKERCLVSPLYTTFKVNDNILIPQYLCLWFNRSEYDRYARFHSWGSARELYSFETLSKTRIPIPNIEIQKSIVNIYQIYKIRIEINEKLKEQIKNICPILIKGSLEEAKSN